MASPRHSTTIYNESVFSPKIPGNFRLLPVRGLGDVLDHGLDFDIIHRQIFCIVVNFFFKFSGGFLKSRF